MCEILHAKDVLFNLGACVGVYSRNSSNDVQPSEILVPIMHVLVQCPYNATKTNMCVCGCVHVCEAEVRHHSDPGQSLSNQTLFTVVCT